MLSLYLARETQGEEVCDKTANRHTNADSVAFLYGLMSRVPQDRDVYIVQDSLLAHKTKVVRRLTDESPQVHFHHAPIDSLWLDQVELWFGKIRRSVIGQ